MIEQFTYDGTFAGLLTAVFDVFEQRKEEAIISQQKDGSAIMFHQYPVITDKKKAERVWKGLKQKVSTNILKEIYYTYLSETEGIETNILYFIRYVLTQSTNGENNYSDRNVLTIKQTARNVAREKHRFEAFVRFNKLSDGLFYSVIEPDFNVLPIVMPHFKRRYADQDWLIYDARRKYGIHYNKEDSQVAEVTMQQEGHLTNEKSLILFYDEDELHYQALWKNYFKSTTILERKNMKLHLQHVPKRYWKYLSEKK